MSIITQCPECTTQFRASPQQLRASQGWVRCGQCDAVFDASMHAVSQRAVTAPDPDAPVPLRVESPAPHDEPELPSIPAPPYGTLFSEPVTAPAAAPIAQNQRWWSVVAAVLAVALATQWVMHEKNMLAARVPVLRPVLAGLCEATGCALRPPQTPESLQIESSAYDPLGEGIYRLSLTLRNTASWPIAFPAIELTVTDAAERPMARRILLPAELGARVDQIDAHSAQELKVYVLSKLPIEPGLSGYRLTAFYP